MLAKIFTFFESLKQVDTSKIKSMTTPLNKTITLNAPKLQKKVSKEAVFANVPQSKYGFYTVPRII
jgi:aspartyl/glutamyl-tRNA(Asn/Gln) amidotransferase C subunit